MPSERRPEMLSAATPEPAPIPKSGKPARNNSHNPCALKIARGLSRLGGAAPLLAGGFGHPRLGIRRVRDSRNAVAINSTWSPRAEVRTDNRYSDGFFIMTQSVAELTGRLELWRP